MCVVWYFNLHRYRLFNLSGNKSHAFYPGLGVLLGCQRLTTHLQTIFRSLIDYIAYTPGRDFNFRNLFRLKYEDCPVNNPRLSFRHSELMLLKNLVMNRRLIYFQRIFITVEIFQSFY